MAKLSHLVSRCSEITGVPDPTVREISRRLREAGLISTGKRGRYGGTDMAPADAACLLTALLIVRASVASLNDIAPLTKSHLQDLICRGDDAHRSWDGQLALPHLSRLRLGHTFGEAFSALIASISNGDLERSIKKWRSIKKGNTGGWRGFEIKVQIDKPALHYEAHIELSIGAFKQSQLYLRRKDEAIVAYPPRNWSDIPEVKHDLRVSATISEPTLKAVGVLLRSPDR
jgi:hypothetical protein